AFVELEEQLVVAGVDIPVNPPDIVAGHVLAVFGKIHAESQVRRPVHPLDEALHDRARNQLEVLNPHQNLGIDKTVFGSIDDWSAQSFNPDFGIGTVASN